MKIVLTLLTLLSFSSSLLAQEDSKIQLLDKKVKREHTSLDHKVSLNFQLGYTHLTAEENDGEDLINTDFSVRYALANWVAVGGGVGKLWDLDGGDVSDDAYTLSSQANIGLTFALSGSLVRRQHFTTDYTTKVYKRENKFLVKNERRETITWNDFDGIRLDLRANQAQFNRMDSAVYGAGAGLYYEALFKNLPATWQVGVRYDYLNNSRVNANLWQAFLGIGFMP